MGSFVFKWPHPAQGEVFVTGTFDDWGKSEQLDKVGDNFEKEVNLPSADEKYHYKFVVDDNWVIDRDAPQEDDGSYNINNVLLPKDIKKHTASSGKPAAAEAEAGGAAAGVGAVGLAAAESNTASDPVESKMSPPGGFPEEPEYHDAEEQQGSFGVAPIPATSGIGNPVSLPAGEKVPDNSAVTDNTIDSTVTTSKEGYERDASSALPATAGEEQQGSFGVAPIPATSGIGNPINLAAGEKVPENSAVTDNTVDSTATTSKEGYERDASAALPAAAGLAGAGGIAAIAGSAFSKPEGKENLIPESALPMGGDAKDTMDSGPHIQSAAPNSSTAVLAAGVPLEKKRQAMIIDPADAPQTDVETAPGVPETVKESMSEAMQSPEAAASPEAVQEKSAMEQELLKKTSTSEATGNAGVTPATQTSYYGLATEVPPTVEKSMQEAHAAPEAAADPSLVAEKSAMENELLQKVPSTEAAGEPAPTIAAATSESAPTATKETPATSSGLSTGEKIAGGAVGGMGAAGVVAALASDSDKATEAPQAVPSSGNAPVGSKDVPASTTDTLSQDEKVAGGAAGGMAGAGSVGALASSEGAGSTFGGGGVFHTDPVGTISKDYDSAKSETVEHFKGDPTHAGQSTSGVSTGAAAVGAGAVGAGAVGAAGILGTPSKAAAAVSDGTDNVEAPSATKAASVPLEKTEGDVAEYAPVPSTKTAPGVSPAAAAAVSDGTEDPTLADEPAVKMMQQDGTGDIGTAAGTAHDATTGTAAALTSTAIAETAKDAPGDIGTGGAFAHDATTMKAPTTDETSSPVPASSTGDAATSSALSAGSAKEDKPTTLGSAAAGTTTAPILTSSVKDTKSGTLGSTALKQSTVPAATGATKSSTTPPAAAAPNTSSTPATKPAVASKNTSSPSSSANTKEKKKRNRLSRVWHKLID